MLVFTEIAASMSKALHFNTYGGNPMASAVGSTVLDVSYTTLSRCTVDHTVILFCEFTRSLKYVLHTPIIIAIKFYTQK